MKSYSCAGGRWTGKGREENVRHLELKTEGEKRSPHVSRTAPEEGYCPHRTKELLSLLQSSADARGGSNEPVGMKTTSRKRVDDTSSASFIGKKGA